jgi:hypothetical protein
MHSHPTRAGWILLLTAVLLLASSGVAQAQWVFLARRALQRINSIAAQVSPSPGPGQGQTADAATVLLEADADKVYAVAINHARENPELQILWQDDAKRAFAFSKGDQSASLKVSRLGDHLSQILVAATYGKSGGTSLVVEAILRVCRQMGVECSQSQD